MVPPAAMVWLTSLMSMAASTAGSAIFFGTIVRVFLPQSLRDYFDDAIFKPFFRSFSETRIVVEKFEGYCVNHVFKDVETYLSQKSSPSTRAFRASKTRKNKYLTFNMDRGEVIVDKFQGMELAWKRTCRYGSRKTTNAAGLPPLPLFVLSIKRKHRQKVLGSYFPYIRREAEALKAERKGLKLRSALRTQTRVDLDHPATFDKLAIDPDLKNAIIADLDRFVGRKEFYKRVGKTWKRGYLLYGPPGTGKSSLIAAIANYLNYHIYDLELSDITRNSDLRDLIRTTSNRSILVIEDIDCTSGLEDRGDQQKNIIKSSHRKNKSQLTLSGLLNFIDGLWSSCGDERIIIFTTNYKEKLDPALLRPGRMDMHIHMSYCTPAGFKILANNYLGIQDHRLFADIEALIRQVEVTPAQIAEELMNYHTDKPDVCLARLLEFLQRKKIEIEKAVSEGPEKEKVENGNKTKSQTETDSETETETGTDKDSD
ncbi:hypothetical protein H6P81_003763 [Aristolochia fimbriata]|uniref:AAA+ ATPase domain-containing protein n=1 Tax=Aristolochia fimbriata TaxID=158543 RepID=A0AAV7FDI6_ARIFI|nr:hypothetical protein H6P81_003763 [Aristolochia fimbriata]